MEDNARWVDERMEALTEVTWRPDTTRAWTSVQAARAGQRRVWWIAVPATAALCLLLAALPSSRAVAQRFWNSIAVKQVEFVRVDPDRFKSLTAEPFGKMAPPRVVSSVGEATPEIGFVPALPTTLAGAPKLSLLGPVHMRLTLRKAAIDADLRAAGIADVSAPAEWEGATLVATFPPSLIASYDDITLMQLAHVSLTLPESVSLGRLGEMAFRIMGTAPDKARVLGLLFAKNPSWFFGISGEEKVALQAVDLTSGRGMLIEDFKEDGSSERIAVVWSTADRLYVLSGRMTRELALATANSVR